MSTSEHMLQELLAVIHGDGGHHVSDHGLEASFAAAMEIVHQLRTYPHGNHNYRAFYEDLVGQIVGDYGQTATISGPLVAGQIAAGKARDAIETLRTFRTSLMMELRVGERVDNCPEVPATPEGLIRTVRQIASDSSQRGRNYEKALTMAWLQTEPKDAMLELTYADDRNPYRWLIEAMRQNKHREGDDEI